VSSDWRGSMQMGFCDVDPDGGSWEALMQCREEWAMSDSGMAV